MEYSLGKQLIQPAPSQKVLATSIKTNAMNLSRQNAASLIRDDPVGLGSKLLAGSMLKSFYDGQLGDQDKSKLYEKEVLVEHVDIRDGVAPVHYADIEPEQEPHTTNFSGSTEFAVIAFWKLDEDLKFECCRFFIVPIPLKREIQSQQSTKLD